MTTTSSPTDWISVADLEKGFATGSYALDNSADLTGKQVELHAADGTVRCLEFDQERLSIDGGEAAKARITSVREGVYLLDWLDASTRPATSYTVVLDTLTDSYTQVIGTLPTFDVIKTGLYERALGGRPLTDVKVDISHGAVNKPYRDGACPHAQTDELIGVRNLYHYSPTEVYEHVYLNENFYTWHCLKGVEQGLCDTDACHYYKITDALYLFIWREKIVPTLGIVMVDERNHRSDGKIFGVGDTEDAPLANFPMASYCQRLTDTEYPDDL
ncbi:molybdenum cofactor biosynthesis F family protein [Halomonas janggokensis]|uniref:Molybdenum cofactor biosynthesis F family protein n=1 Tax=Vreelandella janggokensis TaxID=370767 RepID=A0ABT4IV60_9GAMM|nr:MoaF C-terminal domain-containing protein [Halomonas janggokensis]MCZ0927570.1 molybdenum cofactor biosynthesis F family protein [Halomonas janggokensis]MCZ0930078.1 molybdenum cofactor biosynthesis F family protein [Halomonas janggokensis]